MKKTDATPQQIAINISFVILRGFIISNITIEGTKDCEYI